MLQARCALQDRSGFPFVPQVFAIFTPKTKCAVNLWSYNGAVLAACTLAFFATMAARLAISPVVPAMSAEFGVSNGAIGAALTGMWMAYALSQFPSGLLGDRLGERVVVLTAVVGTAITSGLLAIAGGYALFFAAAVALGAMAGLHYSAATSLLTRTFRQTGTAIGIHSAGAPLAGVLTPVAAGTLGAMFGWRYAVAFGAMVAIPTALLFVKTVRDTPPSRPDTAVWTRIRVRPIAELLARPPILWTGALAFVGAFVWQATASFLPTFLVAHHGYTETGAGIFFSAYFVVQGLGQPLVGGLSDRIGRYPAATLATTVGAVGYGLFVGGSSIEALAIATGCVGIAMSWGAALLPKFMDHLSAEERGAGFGLIRTSYMVLGATGSVATGFAADVWGWGVAFAGLAMLLAGMSIVMLGAQYYYSAWEPVAAGE